ncbi:MAG TPA: hypothetical protein VMV06_03415, partial [Acidimicrobiales bacterium]|nr:hypothetical protein [Acidimicrobiales bacterium]
HKGFSLHGGPGRWRWEPPAHPKATSRRRNRSRPKRPTKATKMTKTTRTTGPGDPDLFTSRE